MDGMRHADEVRELRRKLKADGVAFVAPKGGVEEAPISGGPVSGSGEIPSGALLDDVLRRLRAPRTIDELLDDVQASDLAILEAVALLENGGRVRRVALADLAARIAPEGGIAALRPLVARLAHPAFAMPRMVIATPPRKLSLLAATLQRLVEVSVAAEAPPRIDVARRLGVVRLGDGVEIELVGLPAHDALAPTWPRPAARCSRRTARAWRCAWSRPTPWSARWSRPSRSAWRRSSAGPSRSPPGCEARGPGRVLPARVRRRCARVFD